MLYPGLQSASPEAGARTAITTAAAVLLIVSPAGRSIEPGSKSEGLCRSSVVRFFLPFVAQQPAVTPDGH
jgi:hypothetical protein